MPDIVRMRTIEGCITEFKKIYPDTEVKKNFVRNLVLNKKVASTRAGTKYLVNFDSLLEYLNNPADTDGQEPESVQAAYGKLRKVF